MQLIYPGPFDQVEVPAAGVTAVRGEPVEVPEPHAASLIEQGWTPVRPRPKKEQ
jgi:hypothetical protein